MKTLALLPLLFLSSLWGQQYFTSDGRVISASGTIAVNTPFLTTGSGDVSGTQGPAKPPTFEHLSAGAPEGYAEIVEAMRASGVAQEARMVNAIYEMNLPVYNETEVVQYLDWRAKNAGHWSWNWYPLREDDLKALDSATATTDQTLRPPAGTVYMWSTSQPTRVSLGTRSVTPQLYAHAVPADVLETLAGLIKKVPHLEAFVSDYNDVKPDPFLAVTTEQLAKSGRFWIVAKWDEPNWRGGIPEMVSRAGR